MTDLFKICRYCSSRDQLQVSLFCKYSTDKGLPAKIEECLREKVAPSAGLSGYVCYECVWLFEAFHALKMKMRRQTEPPDSTRSETPKENKENLAPVAVKLPPTSMFDRNKWNFIEDDSASWPNASDKSSSESEKALPKPAKRQSGERMTRSRVRKLPMEKNFEWSSCDVKARRGRPMKKSQTQPLSRDLFDSQAERQDFSSDDDHFDLAPSFDMISKIHH